MNNLIKKFVVVSLVIIKINKTELFFKKRSYIYYTEFSIKKLFFIKFVDFQLDYFARNNLVYLMF